MGHEEFQQFVNKEDKQNPTPQEKQHAAFAAAAGGYTEARMKAPERELPPEASTRASRPKKGEVTPRVLENFRRTGVVSDTVFNSITRKEERGIPLTPQEETIRISLAHKFKEGKGAKEEASRAKKQNAGKGDASIKDLDKGWQAAIERGKEPVTNEMWQEYVDGNAIASETILEIVRRLKEGEDLSPRMTEIYNDPKNKDPLDSWVKNGPPQPRQSNEADPSTEPPSAESIPEVISDELWERWEKFKREGGEMSQELFLSLAIPVGASLILGVPFTPRQAEIYGAPGTKEKMEKSYADPDVRKFIAQTLNREVGDLPEKLPVPAERAAEGPQLEGAARLERTIEAVKAAEAQKAKRQGNYPSKPPDTGLPPLNEEALRALGDRLAAVRGEKRVGENELILGSPEAPKVTEAGAAAAVQAEGGRYARTQADQERIRKGGDPYEGSPEKRPRRSRSRAPEAPRLNREALGEYAADRQRRAEERKAVLNERMQHIEKHERNKGKHIARPPEAMKKENPPLWGDRQRLEEEKERLHAIAKKSRPNWIRRIFGGPWR